MGRSGAALDVTNGVKLNGVKLNGVKLNGVKLNGVKLNGVKLNGVTLSGVTANAGELRSSTKSGAAFAGATLAGTLSDGTTLSMRIDSVSQSPAPDTDVWKYRVSYKDPSTRTWSPLCVSDAGATLDAVVLSGSWNYESGVAGGGARITDSTVFTFACTNSAISKCVYAGYKPWKSAPGFTSLTDHHQACTRLIRADYCGDGTAWTLEGRPINVYDNVGVQTDTQRWLVEAEWTVDGAACMLSERVADLANLPPCLQSKLSLSCGAPQHFSSSVLLMSEAGAIVIVGSDGVSHTISF